VHFKRLLQRLAADGRTIVLSSHILEEVEELAETVLLIVNASSPRRAASAPSAAALNQRPYHVRVSCGRAAPPGGGGRHAAVGSRPCTSIPTAPSSC
jgi:ABC-2 type transport system ATP-binding protein